MRAHLAHHHAGLDAAVELVHRVLEAAHVLGRDLARLLHLTSAAASLVRSLGLWVDCNLLVVEGGLEHTAHGIKVNKHLSDLKLLHLIVESKSCPMPAFRSTFKTFSASLELKLNVKDI